MDSCVTITYQALSGDRAYCRLPVRYTVEDDVILNAPVIHCAIDIPREYIPAWLHPQPLETSYYSEDRMHLVMYNIGDVVTTDARAFCRKIYSAVMQAENELRVVPGLAAF